MYLKRVENLKMLYESGLAEHLADNFPGTTIIVFGSHAFGEDTIDSDIDIAVIGARREEINLVSFEKRLERKISLHFYNDFNSIQKHLKENLCNGIILTGGIQL